MCQGGDIEYGDGSGDCSIYGRTFEDENFIMKHVRGKLSMAHYGKNTNAAQFFILVHNSPHLDGRHVVFGEVKSGMDVVGKIEKAGSYKGKPSQVVTIADCGQLQNEDLVS